MDTVDAQAQALTALLRMELKTEQKPEKLPEFDEKALLALAGAHAVTSLIREPWCAAWPISPESRNALDVITMQIINRSYRLLFYTKYVVGLLEEEGLFVAVLKGVATAEFYPQPELRKCGDVDLLLFDAEHCGQAVRCLERHGFWVNETSQHQHHVAMAGPEGIEVELHSLLTEPFDDQGVNRQILAYQELCREHVVRQSCMGVELPVLEGACHGLSLLLHLLQHFLTAGFGIKLLCDWVVFWKEQPPQVIREMLDMAEKLKVQQFVAAVTLVCMRWLGMEGPAASAFAALGSEEIRSEEYLDRFFVDIVAAEEFGKSEKGRMVALQGRGLMGYVRTFHHQMHLNFPRAGRCPLAWPWLWLRTLCRFLYNNRKLRGTSVASVLKSAEKRGKIAEQMHIFR